MHAEQMRCVVSLMQPTVVGPLSELTQSVRVQGQLPGSTVTVAASGPHPRPLAVGVATAGDQRFPLLAGASLHHDDVLYAVQTIGNDSSAPLSGNQGMPVAPAPASSASFGPVRVRTHLYECGAHVYVDGAVPGADVTVLSGGSPLGAGIADEGVARIGLIPAIPQGSVVAIHQSSSGLAPGPDVSRVADRLPGRPGSQLAPPVLPGPIRGCDSAIEVTGVLDGAVVEVARASGGVDRAGFDLSSEWFVLSSPVDEGDELIVSQSVDAHCERRSTPSSPIVVGPLRPVDPPVVVSPLCAGATVVRVTGLRPGAIVHLSANKETYDGAAPPNQTWLDCRVPGLDTDPVSATQELCGVTSLPSATVTVDPHEDSVAPPSLVGPLLSCTGKVCITRAHRGALLQVFSRTVAGVVAISDEVLALSTNVVVSVAPLLVEGDEVFVRQWACSDTSADSGAERVRANHGPGPADVLSPLIEGDVTAHVRCSVPGATLEVFSRGRDRTMFEFLGSAVSDALHPVTTVALNRPLILQEELVARELLCGLESDPQRPIPVQGRATFGPRPFYVFGHNPNVLSDALDAVQSGANGLEPDLQVYEDDATRLCISHGTGEPSAPALADYLDGLHAMAVDGRLAMVVFDCKEEAVSPDHGFDLLAAIRAHLTHDNDLTAVISVGKIAHGAMFDRIIDILGPREGLMIDAEDDPVSVSNYFAGRGVVHHAYGNGISALNFVAGPYYRYTLEWACGVRAQSGRPRFIYVWTVNAHDELREYLRIGVDGAITDDPADLRSIMGESTFTSLVRLATQADNPLEPANFAYGLRMHTRDKWMAGTDANVTFTITGTAGSASKTVDTELVNRMESDDWNWVTIPSDDLGPLQSITVQRDDQGNGPDWFLDSIDVRSHRFAASATGSFNRWIDNTGPFTVPLV